MSNDFFNHTNRFVKLETVRAGDVNGVFDQVESGFDQVESGFDDVEVKTRAAIKLPDGETAAALPAAGSRANKALSFDENGQPEAFVLVSDIANAQANAEVAINKAEIATTQAGIATTQAGIATAKAAEAAASAASIAGGPVASVNGQTGIVTLSMENHPYNLSQGVI